MALLTLNINRLKWNGVINIVIYFNFGNTKGICKCVRIHLKKENNFMGVRNLHLVHLSLVRDIFTKHWKN